MSDDTDPLPVGLSDIWSFSPIYGKDDKRK